MIETRQIYDVVLIILVLGYFEFVSNFDIRVSNFSPYIPFCFQANVPSGCRSSIHSPLNALLRASSDC